MEAEDSDLPDYLSVLNEEQLQAVVHEGSPLLILAGAGSGKTRVITTKIAYLIDKKHLDPYSILAVTFTKKAANEMRQRAELLSPKAQYAQIKTFHSWGAYFLRKYYQAAGVSSTFTVYDEDDMVTLVTKSYPSLTRVQASAFVHKISLAKDYCLEPDSLELDQIDSDEKFREVYAAYQQRLEATGNVDFGDLIMKPYLVLRDNEALKLEMQKRYRVILVDEYQDSNVAQFLLLKELSGIAAGSSTYVCVVGDDDQSIYKFRGAEVQNILNFQNQFPGTKLVRLQTNYRSTQEILSCADSVVRNNESRLGKTLVAARGKGKKPALVFLPDQDDEVEFCASIIEQAHEKNVPYSDWAILYRLNAQSSGFEHTFIHKKIPYQIVGSLKFYEREEIKDLLAWLGFLVNQKDEVSFRRIINKPARGVGPGTQDKIINAFIDEKCQSILDGAKEIKLTKKAKDGFDAFGSLVDDFSKSLNSKENEGKKLTELISEINEKSLLNEYYKGQDEISGTQKTANLEELANNAMFYPLSVQGLLDFLDSIQLDRTTQDEDESDDQDRVTLITLHNTKGLEFNRVIISGMENGIFPREDKSFAELEEERRLFYVGITRARNELYLTSTRQRRLYGRTNYMEPSLFLSEIDGAYLRVLGQKPSSFAEGSASDPFAKKWTKGKIVFHDDYGEGVISSARFSDEGKWVINVDFFNGGSKVFIPEFQQNRLTLQEE